MTSLVLMWKIKEPCIGFHRTKTIFCEEVHNETTEERRKRSRYNALHWKKQFEKGLKNATYWTLKGMQNGFVEYQSPNIRSIEVKFQNLSFHTFKYLEFT